MKLLIVLSVLAVATSLVKADFLAYLKEIETHKSFQNLPPDEKLLFYELVMAAETSPEATQALIDRVGLLSVIELMDGLYTTDTAKFAAYLSEHLGYSHHRPSNSDIINRRRRDNDGDFQGFLNSNQNLYQSNLNDAERQIWDEMRKAAGENRLTAYIGSVGYDVVFGLMENMSLQQRETFIHLMEAQLQAEAVNRRRRDDDFDDDDFQNALDSNNLNDAERTIWNEMKEAARTNTLTSYIEVSGYGLVFGLIENMSKSTRDRFMNLLEAQLQKEATQVQAEAAVGVVKRQNWWDWISDPIHWGNMNEDERFLYNQMKEAAETNTLTLLIETVGYGPIFGLLENLDTREREKLLDLIQAELQEEATSQAATA